MDGGRVIFGNTHVFKVDEDFIPRKKNTHSIKALRVSQSANNNDILVANDDMSTSRTILLRFELTES